MNIQRWIARREANWKELDQLLRQIERRGLRSLRSEQIRRVASLYRSVSADLARIQTNPVSDTLKQNLQALTSRAYSQIYQGSRRQEWQSVWAFCLWGFPATVRRSAPYIALATLLPIAAGLIAWWFSWQDPTFMTLLVPEALISKVQDQGELWMGSIVGIEPLASSYIMVNNLSVSFAVIAGGITFGLYTAFILILNGLHIGAVAALVSQNNLGFPFWAFVFPHGSLELPAIFFAGGAGFLIARGMLFPGRYRRIDAMRHYGQQAVQLLYGVVVMLITAGTIEGFFSPSPVVPDLIKYFTGTSLFVLLVLYCNRKQDPTQETAPSS